MPVLRELTMRYGALSDDDEMDENLFLVFGGEGKGETVLLPRLKYLDLAGLRIRLHSFDLYKKISMVAPALTHLRLPMRMAGRLEGALGLGVRVAPDRGAENAGVALAGEQVTANGDTTSNFNAPIELGVHTHFQSPTITTPPENPHSCPPRRFSASTSSLHQHQHCTAVTTSHMKEKCTCPRWTS